MLTLEIATNPIFIDNNETLQTFRLKEIIDI